jgi:uncharacterized membrane protein
MKNSILNALKTGLFALLPLLITIAVVKWAYQSLESVFGSFFSAVVGSHLYFPGLGVILAIILVLIVGQLLNYIIIQRFYAFGEKLMTKIPFVKTLYGSLRQFLSFFKTDDKKMGQVVRVNLGHASLVGLMTRKDLDNVLFGKKEEVAVFFPMSYQMGGYTMLVKKEQVELINMPVEDLLKFSITAGVLNPENH